jgi:hypothetical protein
VKKNNGYLSEIKKVWIVKDMVYQQTKDKSFKEYTDIMNKEISEIKKRFKTKYIENGIQDAKSDSPKKDIHNPV